MKALKWGWSEGLRVQLRPLANWKREEPVDEAKPFKIPKREVWEAFKRVKANQGAAGVEMIVAASAALVGASSWKRRSRSATRCRISSSDMAEASLPIEAKRPRACASCVASIASA